MLLRPVEVEGEGITPSPESIIKINGYEYASDRVIVSFRVKKLSAEVETLLQSEKLTRFYRSKKGSDEGWQVLRVPKGMAPDKLVEKLRRHPLVEFAELSSIGRGGATTPTDLHYSNGTQWSINKAALPGAWDWTKGNAQFAIGILDGGINPNHPDLFNKVARHGNGDLAGWDEISGIRYPATNYYPYDGLGHGTAVSSIAGAETTFNNFPGSGVGIAGASPNAPLFPFKVLNSSNNGTPDQLRRGVDDALSIGMIRVLNASLFFAAGEPELQLVKNSVKKATDANVLFVTITGNNPSADNYPIKDDAPSANPTTDNNYFPGRFWTAMAVGSTTVQDWKAYDSVRGNQVSVVAPGDNVYAAKNDGGYWPVFGTSMAAPMVAGVAQLVLSAYPTMMWYDLRGRIEDTAVDLNSATAPGFDTTIGWGRVDAGRAVQPETKANTVPIVRGRLQLVSLPLWPLYVLASDRSQDFRLTYGNDLADPAQGFYALWWDPISQSYLDYSDYRVPRIGSGRSYFVRFNNGRDGNGNPLPADSTAFMGGFGWGGAYPYHQSSHPVSVWLKPRTPNIPYGQPGHSGGNNFFGCTNRTAINWNAQTFKVRLPRADGSAEIISLSEAAYRGLIMTWAYHLNNNTQSWEVVAAPGQTDIPSGFPVVNSLQPGEGYTIYTNIECELLIPSN